MYFFFFFFQAEDGIRDLVRSRGLGDVYKRQVGTVTFAQEDLMTPANPSTRGPINDGWIVFGTMLSLSLIHI